MRIATRDGGWLCKPPAFTRLSIFSFCFVPFCLRVLAVSLLANSSVYVSIVEQKNVVRDAYYTAVARRVDAQRRASSLFRLNDVPGCAAM